MSQLFSCWICSVFEWQESGNTSPNPLIFMIGGRQFEIEHEIGRMTRGGQSSRTWEHLVHWAVVDTSLRLFTVFLWHECDHRHLSVESFGLWIFEGVCDGIPAATFKVKSIDETSCFGSLLHFLPRHVIDNLKSVTELVNSDNALASIILHSAREESLGEEEAGDPVHRGCRVIQPILEHL